MLDVKLLTRYIARHSVPPIFSSLVSILLLLAPSSVRAQEQLDLEALAAKAAAQIHKSLKSHRNKILVIDFADPQAKASGLGVLLADRFADSLRKNTQGLVVLDRARITLARQQRTSSLRKLALTSSQPNAIVGSWVPISQSKD